jgi:predicted pyridoxine 5'-phosphate oxidase superfamily flavin-nucleotide-binding protein
MLGNNNLSAGPNSQVNSPFHSGELSVQSSLGVEDEAAQLKGIITDRLPAIAIKFITSFEFLFIASVDGEGRAWTSILTGQKGFSVATSENIISIDSRTDELVSSNLKQCKLVGLLYINFRSRARLRINGEALTAHFPLRIKTEQVYFNCPKYIQARTFRSVETHETQAVIRFEKFNDRHEALIRSADTFFISSYVREQGADCSHRGGQPGFLEVSDDKTITWIDYPGNNLFNTLGNLLINPKCGLLIINFESHSVLQMTGEASMILGHSKQMHIQFTLSQLNEIQGAIPFEWTFLQYSPYNPRFQ